MVVSLHSRGGSSAVRCILVSMILAIVVSETVSGVSARRTGQPSFALSHRQCWISSPVNRVPTRIARIPRGGAKLVEEEEDSDEEEETDDDSDEEEGEESDDEEEEESDEDEEEEVTVVKKVTTMKKVEKHDGDVEVEVTVTEYDDVLAPSPMLNMMVTFGVMMLARKVDVFNPTFVRGARFAFIGYLATLQIFLLFVRIRAKQKNDRSPVETTNPFSSVLESQLGGAGGGAGMMKNLASSFLSSKSTVVEYDIKQATNMQSGLIFNMAFMWFLHFKMGQVQPILIQTLSGLLNIVYSPLFQVYVLGRNLERPFPNPSVPKPTEGEEEETEQSQAAEPNGAETLAAIETSIADAEEEAVVAATVEDDSEPKAEDKEEEEESSDDEEESDDSDDESDDETEED